MCAKRFLDTDRAAGATIGDRPCLVGGARLDERRQQECREALHVVEAQRHVERRDAGLEEPPQKDPDHADESDAGERPLGDVDVSRTCRFLARRVENRVREEPDLQREDDEGGPDGNCCREPPLGLHDLVRQNGSSSGSHRPSENDEEGENGQRDAGSFGRPRFFPSRCSRGIVRNVIVHCAPLVQIPASCTGRCDSTLKRRKVKMLLVKKFLPQAVYLPAF